MSTQPAAAVVAPELTILTGMSGAGRSTAARCLEDLGWFVVDNLPPGLLGSMVELAGHTQGTVPRIAVVVDGKLEPFLADRTEVQIRETRARQIDLVRSEEGQDRGRQGPSRRQIGRRIGIQIGRKLGKIDLVVDIVDEKRRAEPGASNGGVIRDLVRGQ